MINLDWKTIVAIGVVGFIILKLTKDELKKEAGQAVEAYSDWAITTDNPLTSTARSFGVWFYDLLDDSDAQVVGPVDESVTTMKSH